MTRVNIKIKLNQVIRNEIKKNIKKSKTKYITIKRLSTKFDMINK